MPSTPVASDRRTRGSSSTRDPRALDAGAPHRNDRRVDDDGLPPNEEARDRRRDRVARAHVRALMRTGTAKVFKQILDLQEQQAKEAKEAIAELGDAPIGRRRRGARPGREAGDPETRTEP